MIDLAADFEPIAGDRLGRRADERDAGRGASAREAFVLGQEAVARVDRLRAAALRDLEDLAAVEVAFARRRRSEPVGLVARGDVKRVRVGVRIDGDGADAPCAARCARRGRRSRRGSRSGSS
jgi:hypothetical protein